MFNKYFEFIKALFESVFSPSGETVSFLDYLYVIFFTLALVAVVAVCVVVLVYSVKLPIAIYKRITRGIKSKIDEIDKKIESDDTTNEDNSTLFEERETLSHSLRKRMCYFITGVVFLYVPVVIPTLLFIASFIKSWF